jgi:hypothetical protein
VASRVLDASSPVARRGGYAALKTLQRACQTVMRGARAAAALDFTKERANEAECRLMGSASSLTATRD